MPVFFTYLLASFPAGLVIYWSWNNTLSVLQQYMIMKRQGVKVELWDNLAACSASPREVPNAATGIQAEPGEGASPRPANEAERAGAAPLRPATGPATRAAASKDGDDRRTVPHPQA